jgi:predicted transcriptional regulator
MWMNMAKKLQIKLNKKDEKATRLLAKLGMTKTLAKTIMYLSHVDECYSSDIEWGTHLRQPEVSHAMKELTKRGWITKREQKKEGKGRPLYAYKSTKNLSEIIKEVEYNKLKEIENVKEDISQLKEIKNLMPKK